MLAPTGDGDCVIDIRTLQRQKEIASSGARLEAMTKMVARFRGVSRREKEESLNLSEADTAGS